MCDVTVLTCLFHATRILFHAVGFLFMPRMVQGSAERILEQVLCSQDGGFEDGGEEGHEVTSLGLSLELGFFVCSLCPC